MSWERFKHAAAVVTAPSPRCPVLVQFLHTKAREVRPERNSEESIGKITLQLEPSGSRGPGFVKLSPRCAEILDFCFLRMFSLRADLAQNDTKNATEAKDRIQHSSLFCTPRSSHVCWYFFLRSESPHSISNLMRCATQENRSNLKRLLVPAWLASDKIPKLETFTQSPNAC